MRLFTIFFIGFSVCACSAAHEPTKRPAHAKAMSPLTVTLQPPAKLAKGADNEFQATVQSSVALQNVSFSIKPPMQQVQCRGDLQWQGALDARQSKTLRFTCFVPQTVAGELAVQVQGNQGPSRFTAMDMYQLGTVNTKSLQQGNYDIHEQDGRRIREYSVQ